MTAPPDDAYDRVPYTSHAYAESHPDRLRVVARLSGWDPPALSGARVLEIGCGRGGNLLAMALGLPAATFVGIERSPRQAAEARSLAERLGVTNVTIRTESFARSGDPGEERFDFVVAHGVASWVSPEDRGQLLARVAGCLSPPGIGYVSFNTLPGWYERLAARDWLRFAERAGLAASPGGSVAALRWLRESVSPEHAGYRERLARVERRLAETSPAYAAHEYLEGENHPQLASDFLREAGAAGLAYLGDAIASSVAVETLPEPVQEVARRLAAPEAQELVDFTRNGSFRRALFVRRDAADARGWSWPAALDPGVVRSLRVASRLRPEDPGRDAPRPAGAPAHFRGPDGVVQVTETTAVRALRRLAEVAPRALAFEELARAEPEGDPTTLATELFTLWLGVDGVDLHDHDPAFAAAPGERPRGCPLARWQVARGEPVTNRWHQEVVLPEPAVRAVLARADGTRRVADFARDLGCEEALVRACLEVLARSALLVE